MMIRIDLVLNNRCNFKCSYCCGGLEEYQSNDLLSPVNVTRLLYYLNKNKKIKEHIEFNILGGEPLLYPHLDKIFYSLSRISFVSISMDTNASIKIDNKVLQSIIECNKNPSLITEIWCTYHNETLSKHSNYLSNFYSNIEKLLNNNIQTVVRLLFTNETYTKMCNIKEELSKKFPALLFELRKIFDIKQKPVFLHDYYCYSNNFIGIFPNNKLFYNCEYEAEEDTVKNYDITKENLIMFVSNINVKKHVSECRSVYGCPSKLYMNPNRYYMYAKG